MKRKSLLVLLVLATLVAGWVPAVSARDANVNENIFRHVDENIFRTGATANLTYVTVRVGRIVEVLVPNLNSGTESWVLVKSFQETVGSGTFLEGNVVITAGHILEPDRAIARAGKYSTIETKILRSSLAYVVVEDYKSSPALCSPLYYSQEMDIAVLSCPDEGTFIPLEIPSSEIERSSLKKGDKVAVVVLERDEHGELTYELRVKWGRVISNTAIVPGNKTELAALNPWDFTIDVKLEGGDSGSPVFAFLNGKPVLIGVVRGEWINNNGQFVCSYAVWIGHYVKRVLRWNAHDKK